MPARNDIVLGPQPQLRLYDSAHHRASKDDREARIRELLREIRDARGLELRWRVEVELARRVSSNRLLDLCGWGVRELDHILPA